MLICKVPGCQQPINKDSRFTKKFIPNYDDDSDKGYHLEVDASYPKRLQKKCSDLSLFPE